MFSFFRKYQRAFYAITVLFVASSLISVGALRSSRAQGDADQVLFKTPKGTRYSKREMDQLERLIGRDWPQDTPFMDDVVRRDFLMTGLADVLVESFGEIESDLRAALVKERRWRPYCHPHLPYLDVQRLWELFAPQLQNAWLQFCKLDSAADAPRLFTAKKELFLVKSALPSEQLRQLIWMQQGRTEPAKFDRQIATTNLEVLGNSDVGSWFGSHFLRLCAQIITIGAEEAKSAGLKVSKREAKADLLAKVVHQQRKKDALGAKDRKEVAAQYASCLETAQMSESELLDCYQRILLFRRWIWAHCQRWSVDASIPLAFDRFARASRNVQLFTLDESFALKDFEDWAHFEMYCRAVSENGDTAFAWPKRFKPIEQLWRDAPELLEAQCRVRQVLVTGNQLRATFTSRDVLEWLSAKTHWSALCAAVGQLPQLPPDEIADRIAAIEGLDTAAYAKVDDLARRSLLVENPQILHAALDGAGDEVDLCINGAGVDVPYSFIRDKRAFAQLVRSASMGKSTAQDALLNYSEDQEHYLSLRVLHCSSWQRLTWHWARAKGAMRALADQGKSSRSEPIQDRPPFKALQRTARQIAIDKGSEAVWVHLRQIGYLESARDALISGSLLEDELCSSELPLDFVNQWKLRARNCQIERADEDAEKWPHLFDNDTLWSSIRFEGAPLGFYRRLPSKPLEEGEAPRPLNTHLLAGLSAVRENLAADLDRRMAVQWLRNSLSALVPVYGASTAGGQEEQP